MIVGVSFLLLTCFTKLKCRTGNSVCLPQQQFYLCHTLGAGTLNGHSGKKRKKQSDAYLPQPGGVQGDVEQAAASLPSHGSLLAQAGALHLIKSLLQVDFTSPSQNCLSYLLSATAGMHEAVTQVVYPTD